MTVATTNLTANFTGDGSTTTFPFTFALQLPSDLQVFLNSVIQLTSVYTVSINANGVGGNVIFITAPAAAVKIFFERVLPFTQLTHLSSEGAIPSISLEQMIDRTVMIDQQLSLAGSLTLSIPASLAGIVSTVLPIPIPSAFLQWDPTGTFIVSGLISTGGGALGPSVTTPNALALWNSTNGTLLANGPALGTTGQVLTSNGPGVAPSFQNVSAGAALPSGSIIMWYGSTSAPPSGYVICDGNNGTPNMIGMIPMGAQFSGGVASPNANGYGNQLTTSLGITVGSATHTHNVSGTGTGSGATNPASAAISVTSGGASGVATFNHAHSFSVATTVTGITGFQNTGAGTSALPASLTLAFIMKS